MKTLLFLLRKEFRQIFRNKSILAIIFMMPTIQLLILPLAANYEVKNINISIVDNDKSGYSKELISKISGTPYFKLQSYESSYTKALKNIENDAADLILEIPKGFERNLIRDNEEKLFVAVNAINGSKAGLGANYLQQTIADFNHNIRMKLKNPSSFYEMPTIEIRSENWFNKNLNYQKYFVPGILALLVTLVGGFLATLNIVKEKEIGTIEQINVTPIKKHHFILGKLIPFWILANIVFTIGLLLARYIYGIVPEGNMLVMYAFVAIYLLAILGFGLLVSTYCESQQQAMLVMFFFQLIFLLLGGLFTPIDSMPEWAIWISKLNPVAYLIDVMRMFILKGSGFHNVLPHFACIIVFALVFNIWAVINYKKTN
ncbi:ABC transporter permease [Flavobacterium sp.]|uniref:ABC transporter permease n=1 Tax=Flavobacterium sp. TaxID=239 RepID=UPI0028BEEAA2|nr:ABC transporter permease [Flavobacterium sp.]